jgi:hypothetical protein
MTIGFAMKLLIYSRTLNIIILLKFTISTIQWKFLN